ncbi:MAG TPA: glycosyltransferase family 87 protein [Bryobacteraceae bacterium]
MRSLLETWGPAGVAILGSAVFFIMVLSPVMPYARTHDFLGLYSGGVLVRTDPAHLYDPDAQMRVQLALAPEIPVLTPFPRPAFSALFYSPFTWLPLRTAFALWVTLGILGLFAIWTWAARRFGPEILVYCAFFVPFLFGIAHGQDTVFIAGLLILTYCALESGRKVLGGVLLGLLMCKFHLFLLVPAAILIRKEWRILAGYVPTAAAAAGLTIALASPASYLAFLRNSKLEALQTSPEMMLNVNSITLNLGFDYPWTRILLIALILAAVFAIPRTAPLDRWFWAAVCGSMLISPHTFAYDGALLLIPILKILADSSASPIVRGIAATAVIPLPYFMTLLPKPYSGAPALLIFLLFLVIAWPEWFRWRPWALRTAVS